MITFEMAKRKVEKKKHKIVKSIELPDRFAFIVIPEDADLDNIQAKMENGVLEVTFKKMEPLKKQRRTIQIQ